MVAMHSKKIPNTYHPDQNLSRNTSSIAALNIVAGVQTQTASPFAQEMRESMPLKVVLAVGVDSWMLATHIPEWRAAGFIVLQAFTMREAFEHFKIGDFDLVLLGNALSTENKERLTFLVRSSGSSTPVLSIADSSGNCDSFASATVRNDAPSMLQCMGELLATESKLRLVRSLHFETA
jgi:hypothetical protein